MQCSFRMNSYVRIERGSAHQFWKCGKGLLSIRQTLKLFQRQRWGNVWVLGWSAYKFFHQCFMSVYKVYRLFRQCFILCLYTMHTGISINVLFCICVQCIQAFQCFILCLYTMHTGISINVLFCICVQCIQAFQCFILCLYTVHTGFSISVLFYVCIQILQCMQAFQCFMSVYNEYRLFHQCFMSVYNEYRLFHQCFMSVYN